MGSLMKRAQLTCSNEGQVSAGATQTRFGHDAAEFSGRELAEASGLPVATDAQVIAAARAVMIKANASAIDFAITDVVQSVEGSRRVGREGFAHSK